MHTKVWLEKLKGRYCSEDVGTDGRIILELILKKLGGKILLRRPGHRWKDHIRIDLKEIGWEDVDWVHLA